MKRGGPIKRRTPLRRRGETNQDALWRDARSAVLERDHYECRLPVQHECWGRLEVHHIRRRSQGGNNDPANLVTLCTAGHAWVHEHPAKAYELGLLSRGAT